MADRGGKRRGKPNRGGGRFNRGGPSRGRGSSRGHNDRGRGAPRGSSAGPTQPTQGVYRKTDDLKSGLLDYYDDLYDDEPGETEAESYRLEQFSKLAQARGATRARPGRRKVAIQQLHMSVDNQQLVRQTLRQLHQADGDDDMPREDHEVDELPVRLEDQYWTTNSRLQVVDDTVHRPSYEAYDTTADHDITKLAKQLDQLDQWRVDKLARYGFERRRCEEALRRMDGDIGQALEDLLCACFGLDLNLNDDNDIDWNDIKEQRNEEKIALSSIYEGSFVERVPNRVWVIRLELPHLSKMFPASLNPERLKPKGDVCKFYLQGRCKFGLRCRQKHSSPYDDPNAEKPEHLTDELLERPYELELRFPEGNRYPLQQPVVAFASHNKNIPNHICLNITEQLMLRAAESAADGLPAVFTLISTLENEEEIQLATTREPPAFCFPQPVISPHHVAGRTHSRLVASDKEVPSYNQQEPEADEVAAVEEEEETLRGETQKFARRDMQSKANFSPAQAKQMNQKIKQRFSKKQSSDEYKRMLKQRQGLPAWDQRSHIVDTVMKNQVVVICGMTGCGKTTQVPQYLLEDLMSRGEHVNMMCTQPRRISAMSVAERVAEERLEKLGYVVGYQIRLEASMSQWTRLLFCTTGILLRRLEGDAMLDGLTHIILDEVHERTEQCDFLMMVLRDLLKRRPDLKVLLMSATVNAELFSEYFNNCPIIQIPGKAYPVEQLFLEDAIEYTGFVAEEKWSKSNKQNKATHDNQAPSEKARDGTLNQKQLAIRYADYSKSTVSTLFNFDHDKICYELIESLIEFIVYGEHEYPQTGGVLVFLPGMQEISTLYEQLLRSPVFGGKNKHKFMVVPLHSTLSSAEQHAVFRKPGESVRKIVLSTNIAETSITIDDIVYVIDSARMKEKRYDSTKGMESLDLCWVSRAHAIQRRGRAGRVMEGVCFHLITSNHYRYHLQDQPLPEIKRVPLEQLCLQIKILDLFKAYDLQRVMNNLLEPPTASSIDNSIKRLQDLGALDAEGQLTALGYHLASLPVDVRIGKLMLFGAIFRCLDAALTIAATLSYKSPFVSPFDKRSEADKKRLEFAIGNSDHLTTLQAYNGWVSASKLSFHAGSQFCHENYLSLKNLQMLASMKRQFAELLSDIGFVKEGLTNRDMERLARDGSDGIIEATGVQANSNSKNMKLVAAILVAALYPNIVKVMTPETKYSQTGTGAVPRAPNPDEIKFCTKTEYNVSIHPSSVNFQVRHYESPYLVYHEKVKTSKVYIRDCSMVSVYPLLLFAGGNISIDLHQGQFVMSVDDGWIRFLAASHEVAQLVRELRQELDQLLEDKINDPSMNLATCPRGSRIIDTIVQLISTQ